ncbi:MAG: D-alanyl-D-alanine carboxypeptidase [Clostridiales bacterium]|uniref:D-alanyl-D-alanine carboxypeptidase family protein n=1 Tax=Clostridium sp. N3C TaxID=1776758 RepID=UPI00092E1ECD|nr:D-alanyl-D-alanine carboxypeptidase family protein [Clostridium sp. N3C]NLZ49961.1 D-alanyl-D-alanine carboxypeptidase [Clostridiales bacterium]SCN22718.1 D-alanyl-D-alanine carboxypeptidase DacB precursor [Clostridium sp. N3C]
MNKKYNMMFFFLILVTFFSNDVKVFANGKPPAIVSQNAIIMDGNTGKILYSKNINGTFPPASTTKLMTALLAIEKCKLDDLVAIGKNPPLVDGSKAGIKEKELVTVKDMLYGLLFVSGNDCANALAEHMAGSVENFAKMMNKRAKELGLTNTSFVNPSGLYHPNQKSTVKDLALIMRELVKYKEYLQIATDNRAYYITPKNCSGAKHPICNQNKMVWKGGKYYFDGIEGGKTGYTIQSKFSYVVSAKRNGKRLIVALHSSTNSHYTDAIKLLNYGFSNFK